MASDRSLQVVQDLLRLVVSKQASDLFITAGFPPALKLNGVVEPVGDQRLSPQHTADIARALMNDKQAAEFESTKEANFAISPTGIGRFRVSAYMQQGRVALVLRLINNVIPKFEDLNLPPVIRDVTMMKRGLILMIGGTGQGKSTSLAAMVGYRNEHTKGHIITVEDPVEFVHEHKNCVVSQRDVGIDTESWYTALRNALRQAPDVILIGEVRDRETMEHAIEFAETGHLCMATLHANSSNQALDRIINFFPEDRKQQVLMDLSLNIRAFIAQRLVAREDGKGRVAAVEIMLNTPLISDLIFKGDIQEIKEIMKKSREHGMQTFDQHLFELYESHTIGYEDALRNADSKTDLRLNMKLSGTRGIPTRPSDPSAPPTIG